MFLRKAFLVLFVAILGTSWFLGEGFVAANPIVQYQAAAPGYGYPYGQPPAPGYGYPYGQPPAPGYGYPYGQQSYTDPRKNGPLIRGWDALHAYGQNLWLAGTGQM